MENVDTSGALHNNTSRRQTSIELLRLLCMFGIVTMHSFGPISTSASILNHVYGTLINSIFNTGVSIFMLISGYYGIRFSIKKCVALEIQILFYSVVSFVILGVISDVWSLKELIRALFPVMKRKYWYITVYMVLMLFSKYINMVPEKLSKKSFEELLILMLLVFSIIPTILHSHVMGDNGKGLMNMLLMYWIGRYIRLYGNERNDSRITKIAVMSLALGFLMNMGSAVVYGFTSNIFARDYSIVIVIASIAIFMMFQKWSFYVKWVNTIAAHTLAIYLFEGTVRQIVGLLFDVTQFARQWFLFAVLAVYVIFIMICCIVIEVLRKTIMGRPEQVAITFFDQRIQKLKLRKAYFNLREDP